MKCLLALVLISSALSSKAQYYYKDIVGTAETNGQMKRLRDAGVRTVTLVSFDGDGSKSEALDIHQNLTGDRLVTTTVLDSNTTVLVTVLDAQARVTQTIDSSEAQLTTTSYSYNSAGQLEVVESFTTDPTGKFTQREVHRWEWTGGRVTRMARIKNGIDSTIASFVADEKGNVAEEHLQRTGYPEDVVYYYYNESRRMTDIVRYNEKAKRLLPEYMFEYNEAGQVIQRITVPSNNSNYNTWRYLYDSRGLKVKEALYDRYKQQTGRVEYQYQTGS
jgi:hypothetical protein